MANSSRKMRFILAAVAAIAMAQPATAQTLRNSKGPANLPPESFDGRQFIDNRGCVFIRSTKWDGTVTWIPRVSAKRRHLCSKTYQPTFAEKQIEDKPVNVLAGIFGPKKTPAKKEPSGPTIEERVAAVQAELEPTAVDIEDPAAVAETAAADAAMAEAEAALVAVETPDEPEAAKPTKPKRQGLRLGDLFKKRDKAAATVAVAETAVVEEQTAALVTVDPRPRPNTIKPQAPVVVAEPEPVVVAEPEPVVVAEPEPVIVAEPEPVVVAEPDPVVVAEPEPVIEPEPAPVQVAALDPRLTPAADIKRGIYVNIGQTNDINKSIEVSTLFRRSGYSSVVTPESGSNTILLGPFRTNGAAKAALATAKYSGYANAQIVQR